MKIVLVSLQFKETATGGGGVHVKNICDKFLGLGENVTVISIHTERTLPGVDIVKNRETPYSIQKRENLTIIRFLIDAGIEQPYVGNKDVELKRIKRFADAAIAWVKETEDEIDVVHLHGHHIIPGYMAKELQGIKPKVVSTIHALESTYMASDGNFVGAFNGTKKVLSRIREWEAMTRYADHIVVNSLSLRQDFREIVCKFDKDVAKYDPKIELISSGCEEEFFMSNEEIGKKLQTVPETINLVTFCRIDPSKGVEFAIDGAKEAAKQCPRKFCLTIAGIPASEEYACAIRQKAKDVPENLKIKIKFLKVISSTEEKKQILDDKHIYILPTLKEPFGMSILEASARGNMVISADTDGPAFMFEKQFGKNQGWGIITRFGTLVTIPEDYRRDFSKNIAKAIVWVMKNWQESAKSVATFNKKIVDTWTWRGIARQYIKLFQT